MSVGPRGPGLPRSGVQTVVHVDRWANLTKVGPTGSACEIQRGRDKIQSRCIQSNTSGVRSQASVGGWAVGHWRCCVCWGSLAKPELNKTTPFGFSVRQMVLCPRARGCGFYQIMDDRCLSIFCDSHRILSEILGHHITLSQTCLFTFRFFLAYIAQS